MLLQTTWKRLTLFCDSSKGWLLLKILCRHHEEQTWLLKLHRYCISLVQSGCHVMQNLSFNMTLIEPPIHELIWVRKLNRCASFSFSLHALELLHWSLNAVKLQQRRGGFFWLGVAFILTEIILMFTKKKKALFLKTQFVSCICN